MEKNDNVKKANEELEYLEGDAAFKRRVELREKYERDYKSAMNNSKKIGEREGKLKIAKKLLQKGMSIDEISVITELSIEEIEELK